MDIAISNYKLQIKKLDQEIKQITTLPNNTKPQPGPTTMKRTKTDIHATTTLRKRTHSETTGTNQQSHIPTKRTRSINIATTPESDKGTGQPLPLLSNQWTPPKSTPHPRQSTPKKTTVTMTPPSHQLLFGHNTYRTMTTPPRNTASSNPSPCPRQPHALRHQVHTYQDTPRLPYHPPHWTTTRTKTNTYTDVVTRQVQSYSRHIMDMRNNNY